MATSSPTSTLSGLIPAGNTKAAQSFVTSTIPSSALTPPTSAAQACQMARAINSSVINKLNALQNKMNALQNAVNALSNAFPIPSLPNLGDLTNFASVDINSYRALQQACPQLNLPSLNGLPSVPDLQSLLNNAISQAIKDIDQSPLGMLNTIESQFNSEIAALLAELGTVTSLLNCLCQAGQFSTDIQPPKTASAINTYNYITGQGSKGSPSILSNLQQQQVQQSQQTRLALRQLLTVPSS